MSSGADDPIAAVSTALWEQRELLELLLFTLTVEKLIAEAGEIRWISHSAQQVEAVTDQIRLLDIVRSAEVDRAARSLGLPPGPSLRELTLAASEPWAGILADHLRALRELTDEVRGTASGVSAVLESGARSVRDALRALDSAFGSPRDTQTGPFRRRLDEQA